MYVPLLLAQAKGTKQLWQGISLKSLQKAAALYAHLSPRIDNSTVTQSDGKEDRRAFADRVSSYCAEIVAGDVPERSLVYHT
jgi:hypothetical protein